MSVRLLYLIMVRVFGWLVLGPASPYPVLALLMIATGFGCSLTMPAVTVAIMSAAPADRGGIASGVLNTARQSGGALGVAVLGLLVAGRTDLVPGLGVGLALAGVVLLAGALTAIGGLRRPADSTPDRRPDTAARESVPVR